MKSIYGIFIIMLFFSVPCMASSVSPDTVPNASPQAEEVADENAAFKRDEELDEPAISAFTFPSIVTRTSKTLFNAAYYCPEPSPVPLPGALWMAVSGVIGLVALGKRNAILS